MADLNTADTLYYWTLFRVTTDSRYQLSLVVYVSCHQTARPSPEDTSCDFNGLRLFHLKTECLLFNEVSTCDIHVEMHNIFRAGRHDQIYPYQY